MTDSEIILRHAREYALLIGTDPRLVTEPLPLIGPGAWATRCYQRRQRVPRAIAARQAAIRLGIALGVPAMEVCRILHGHVNEAIRPAPIPLSQQHPDELADRRGKYSRW